MYTICKESGRKLLKPGLKLIGAKIKHRDKLYKFFPKHSLYIEPFLGTGGVLIGKEKSPREVVGDLNWYVINYYKTLQDCPEGFWDVFKNKYNNLLKGEKKYFEHLKYELTIPAGISNIEKSVNFYLITKHCFNGIIRFNKEGKCNSSWGGTIQGRGIFTRKWFDLVRERIKDVEFNHCRYENLIIQSINNSFTFMDPPYHDCLTTYNGESWDDDYYKRFYTYVNRLYGKWMITLNKDDFVLDLFKDFNIYNNDGIFYSCSQTPSGRGNKEEVIITNYDIESNIESDDKLLSVKKLN